QAANQPPGMPMQPPAGPMVGVVGGLLIVFVLAGIMVLASEVLALIGYIFCINANPKHGAKTLAIVTLALAGGSLLFFVISHALTLTGRAAVPGAAMNFAAGGPIGIIANQLSLGKVIVFLFFLRAVALCVREWSLYKSV